MINLRCFLEASCQYSRAASLAGLNLGSFRNQLHKDLNILSKTLNISLHPLRAAHLRHQEQRLRELLALYDLQPDKQRKMPDTESLAQAC